MRLVAVLVAGLVVGRGAVWAQTDPTPAPIYHGVLDAAHARGSIKRPSGLATLRVPGWLFSVEPGSDGIDPSTQPVWVAIGDTRFFLPAGACKASRDGKRFVFRQKGPMSAGIRTIMLRRKSPPDSSYPVYRVRFTVTGIDLSKLEREDPVCLPLAVIVGDDDGFQGVNFSSPRFTSHRLRVVGKCDATGDWPWLGG